MLNALNAKDFIISEKWFKAKPFGELICHHMMR